VPTYEYECDRCHRVYEVRQRISASPLTECQYCQGPIRRLLAPAPFILKGGGWYVTDYPSESRKKAMDAEKKTSEAPAGSAKPGDGKSAEKSADAKSSDGGGSAAAKTDSSSSTSGTGGSSTTA
jgi:putative FmdB family regulatory protein